MSQDVGFEQDDEAPGDLATDYAAMIVGKWRKMGQPPIELGAALMFQAADILFTEGVSREGVAEMLRELAKLVEDDAADPGAIASVLKH
ncbi:hypothetical protein [Enterovirga aerilata]|uniref:Uncharacterized protein n=1 Tax=Enterovirga aerilata TaxID=2730920 RepID=A0A849I1G4_9HYPH|nr:hypothetical protein [Enterovirga sp. DB1703]NNM71424.1 hypothetical protein [Enterovirga sp. DB1703]